MRIAFQSVFYPYRGGIAQFNASLFRALENLAEVKAFNFSLQYPSLFFPGSSQYVATSDKADKIPSTRSLNSINPISYYNTAKEINRFSPDLLLTAYWLPFLAPAQGSVCKLLKKKTLNIALINNITPHEKKLSDYQLNKFFLEQQHGYVVMGNAIKNELLQYVSHAQYLQHPHPIYAHFGTKIDKQAARFQLKIDNDKKTLLFFGLIRPYKGLDLLIEAFSKLDDSYQLVIAGESYEDFNKYQQLIDVSPNRERIHIFDRYIPDGEVPLFFSAADLCVLPYKSATQSGVVAAAFHFDLPVVVTDKGNLKDIIEPYGTGLVSLTTSAHEIAKHIKDFFEKGQADLITEKIKKFKIKYTWSHLAKEIIDLHSWLK